MKAATERFTFPDDGTIIRWGFYALMAVCLVVLYLDYRELAEQDPLVKRVLDNPIPPAVDIPLRQNDGENPTVPYSPTVQTSQDILRKPLEIKLAGDNRLELTGTIDPGAAQRFIEETSKIAEYIDMIVLNSPGGSVDDALSISETIRKNKWNTHVNDGALCASSCPIVFAGGVKRTADEKAAIGVHQIYSAGGDTRSLDQAISGTQHSTATIVRHLEEMGTDPDLWIHALETPPRNLYYFKPEELDEFKLVTIEEKKS